MSGLQVLIKDPGESRLYGMDFASKLLPGETISSITSVVFTPVSGTTPLVLSGSPAVAGSQAQFRLLAGDDSIVYEVVVTIVTSAANILIGRGGLRIRLDPA